MIKIINNNEQKVSTKDLKPGEAYLNEFGDLVIATQRLYSNNSEVVAVRVIDGAFYTQFDRQYFTPVDITIKIE